MPSEPGAEPALTAARLLAAARSIGEALAGIPAGANIADLTRVFAEIQCISELRRTPVISSGIRETEAAYDSALNCYHSALEAWAKELPRIHGLLLAEKHRLETREEHARSLSTWIDAQRQTR